MGSTEPTAADYSAPPEAVAFDGLLFDMDGTIIDSTDAVVKHWERCVAKEMTQIVTMANLPRTTSVGKEIGVDPEVILQCVHMSCFILPLDESADERI